MGGWNVLQTCGTCELSDERLSCERDTHIHTHTHTHTHTHIPTNTHTHTYTSNRESTRSSTHPFTSMIACFCPSAPGTNSFHGLSPPLDTASLSPNSVINGLFHRRNTRLHAPLFSSTDMCSSDCGTSWGYLLNTSIDKQER